MNAFTKLEHFFLQKRKSLAGEKRCFLNDHFYIQGVFLIMVKNLRDNRGPLDKQLLPYAFFFVSAI